MKNSVSEFSITVVIFSLFLVGGAEKSWATEVASQYAHVHGRAELSVVLEDNSLHIDLVSPAVNIVGFESHSQTAEQLAAVERAVSTLESVPKLFVFEGTDCSVQKIDVDVSVVAPKNKTTHIHGLREDEHIYGDGNEHGEIAVRYRFLCREGANLDAISFDFLELFGGIESLRVMWITGREQRTQTLSGDAKRIALR